MEIQEARNQLKALQAKMSAFSHAMGLLSYDGATTAPKATAKNRAQTLSVLSEESYKLQTGEETVSLLEFLDAHKEELPADEQRMVHILIKDIRQMQKVPMEEYVAFQKLLVESDDVWHTAKETNDFPIFEPYLEKIFATVKKFAGYFAPEKDPYDFWLSEFEDGLDRETCDKFFATLRSRIVPLLKKVSAVPQVSDKCLWGHFPEDKQDALSKYLMELIGLDLTHVGLSTTEHPFTTSLGSHLDTRITTNYSLDNFASSLFSVVHEGGHALYDTGSDDSLCYTCLDGGVSMGIHESQSRFYENLIGRSLPFIELIFPKLKELFPQQMENVTAMDVYKAVNKAEPSLIRVDADEVTYCLHIMVRYELEKKVMAGEITVHDLPNEWNRLYKEYLGVDVPDDKHGVLQDTHWSGGAIGYFPSYALGSAYGAQLLKKMKEEVDVDTCIKEGNVAPITAWNKEHIWKYGCLKTPKALLEEALGGEFDPLVYCDYLEAKCKDIYGI